MRELFWWIFGGTVGGLTRAEIIKALKDRPYNANQLAQKLGLDYKTVRYHLDVLERNGLVKPTEQTYPMYFLTEEMEKGYQDFEMIYEKIAKKK
ncbi:MAG: winged helix-turn-helix domain-containing protein [Euryarchaeota archaeon]|nr:winged helix-turn-helix domain-containing protein [Euryarchaeota archaeon]